MTARHFNLTPQAGFTLVELVMTVVILGILSVYAFMNSTSSADLSLPSQAQTMAADLRYTQMLAHTSGKRMRLKITSGANGSYSAGCVSGSCAQAFSASLKQGVVLNGTATLDFDTLGQPSSAASYTLKSPEGSVKTVTVAPLTGLVTVTP
ncbi:MAG: hypothetical protein RugAbin2_00989 [Rugosibacter sp.]|jgi:MSHA pilin protein MshC|nr:hypothetical protein [Rugosibacter sp.]